MKFFSSVLMSLVALPFMSEYGHDLLISFHRFNLPDSVALAAPLAPGTTTVFDVQETGAPLAQGPPRPIGVGLDGQTTYLQGTLCIYPRIIGAKFATEIGEAIETTTVVAAIVRSTTVFTTIQGA
jgi:hypothetical protein